ncbi:KdsC family phosphatase [Halotalea alkalilenta]|uniref:KdsC family phosphatase n=1 Tax=Halotalea alkalilenta TaxID=376489 RepID=UPI000480EC56|nr:HAD hydrolase family protein [Halotalea alkalilenta]
MTLPSPSLGERASRVRLLALDVDGVLTDGAVHYHSDGGETKVFDTQDGLGLRLALEHGIDVALITGRDSPMVARRAGELGIAHLLQGRNDKHRALTELASRLGIALDQCAYCGDDLPDLGAIQAAGLGLSVANAPEYVRVHADYVTERRGGQGAVRELCELLLEARGAWAGIVAGYLLPRQATP